MKIDNEKKKEKNKEKDNYKKLKDDSQRINFIAKLMGLK